MELYQTKVDDNLHLELKIIAEELVKDKFISKPTKYEITKFALINLRDMFKPVSKNNTYNMLKNANLPLLKEGGDDD
ncbi:MAG: hypothetical protein QW046_04230 [Candidatus Micrarchaeaceae archaeon]